MEEKQHLLGKLEINRESGMDESGTNRRLWVGLGVAGLIILAVSAVSYSGLFTTGDLPLTAPEISGTNGTISASAGQTSPQGKQEPQVSPAAREYVLNASGYVTARRMATVSSEITDRIVEILIEEGMRVEAGQIIARLDDSLAQVELRLAMARVDGAAADMAGVEVDLAEAERILQRARELSPSEFVSEAELSLKQSRVDALVAGLARARANHQIAMLEVERRQEAVDKYLIRAPFSGVIIAKAAQAGEIVSPMSAGGGFTRTGIGTIVDMDSLEIEVDVSESYIGRVSPGQLVTATLDAYTDWQIPASVIAIIPTADRAKATVRVRIAIETRDPRILPDMGVKVVFHGPGDGKAEASN